MSTRKFLDLSTAHLSPAARETLKAAAADTLAMLVRENAVPPGVTISAEMAQATTAAAALITYPMVYGWFCYAHDDYEALAAAGVPEELIAILRYARADGRDCDYIMFDSDADTVDGLPTWDW